MLGSISVECNKQYCLADRLQLKKTDKIVLNLFCDTPCRSLQSITQSGISSVRIPQIEGAAKEFRDEREALH